MALPVLRELAEKLRAAGPSEDWTVLPHTYASRRIALTVAGQIRRGERAGWGPPGSFDARHGDGYVEVRFRGDPRREPK
jgi:hypothetical protein